MYVLPDSSWLLEEAAETSLRHIPGKGNAEEYGRDNSSLGRTSTDLELKSLSGSIFTSYRVIEVCVLCSQAFFPVIPVVWSVFFHYLCYLNCPR